MCRYSYLRFRSLLSLIAGLIATLVVATPLLAQSSAPVLVTQAVDNAVRTRLPGNVHPMARAEFDRGEAPPDLPLKRMLLVLKRSPEQESALRGFIDDQQDKDSPRYHQWVTPEEFGATYGPADSDIAAVVNWLKVGGFEVTSVSTGRTVIEFSGTARLVKQAFGTAIHKFAVDGEEHWANASDPSIPKALVPVVVGVDSLHNFQKKAMNNFAGTFSKDKKTGNVTAVKPQFTFPAGCFPVGQNCNAVGPYDFATIYDLLPLWNAGIDGTGQTIAIVGRTDINPQDATDFWNLFGLPVPPDKLIITPNGPHPGINGDEAEADIDIQWSGAAAPGAIINFVTSASTETTDGVDLSALFIVDKNLAPVMSTSYGLCELGLGTAGNQFYGLLWEQAAAQGISSFVSSGDNGGAGCDFPGSPARYGLNVNGLASTPFNTAVGGTDFNQYNKWSTYWNSSNDSHHASAKSYIPETTWNDSCTNNFFIVFGGFGTTPEAVCNNPTIIQDGFVNSVGGSGGRSNCVVNNQTLGSCSAAYAKPSWQTGTGTQTDHVRDLPDISLFSSDGFVGSFYIVCQTDTSPSGTCDLNSPFFDFAGYGGTSVATPAFAGIMALVNQKWGAPQGNPGFVLYKLASSKPTSFHDVPSGSTIGIACFAGSPDCTVNTPGHQFGVLSGFSTGAAYDLATGLGSVDANNMVNNWKSVTFTATTTTLQLNHGSAVNVTHGASVPVNIGVTPIAATGDAALLVYVGPGTVTGPGIDGFTLTSGSVSGTTSLLPGGTYDVVARYAGNGTYGGSYSSPVSVTVAKENSTVFMPGVVTGFDGSGNPVYATSVAYGSPYLLRANVQNSTPAFCDPPPSGQIACPTGTVTLTDNGNPLDAGSYTLNGLAYIEDRTVQLPGGTDSVTSAYSGDKSFNASSTTTPINITPAQTWMPAPTVPSWTILVGSTTWVNATVQSSSAGVAPTGTVTLYADGTALPVTPSTWGSDGSAYAGASLSAYFQPTFTTPGTKAITVAYSGDANYKLSMSPAASLSVLYGTTETITSSAQVVSAGTPVTLTALVDTTVKNIPLTGTFTFYSTNGVVNGTPTVTQITDSNGYSALQATLTVTITSTIDFSFHYSGDSNYIGGQSNDIQIGVPDFSIFPVSNGVTVTAGQSLQLDFNINYLHGFTGTVGNFTCSGLPAEAACSFNPTQVTSSGTTTLTITTAPIGQSRQRTSLEKRRNLWPIEPIVLIGICLIGITKSRREAGVVLLVCILVLLPSCGGGGGSGGGGGGVTPNPTPSITSLSPTQFVAGSSPVPTVMVNGSGFLPTSIVTYGGSHPAVQINNSNQIGLELSQSDIATIGKFPVVVTNPPPGGGASNSMDFKVTTGTPTGTFTVTVTATSGTAPNQLAHSTTFILVVQ